MGKWASVVAISGIATFLSLLALAACTPAASPTPSYPLKAPPDVQATVTAGVNAQLTAVARLTPTPAAAPDPRKADVATFATSYASLVKDWDAFNQDYLAWRRGLGSCSEDARRQDLRDLSSRFNTEIASPASALTRPPDAQGPGGLLANAASQEAVALQQLRDTWVPGRPEAFLIYEKERAEVEKLRRQGADALERGRRGILEPPSSAPPKTFALPKNPQSLEEFAGAWAQLSTAWDAFHKEYDAWRQRDGDCPRAQVARGQDQLLQQFGSISSRAFALPRPAAVRPLVELLNEAAEKEGQALRALRDTWQPYDLSYTAAFERTQNEADRLRRQVGAALDDMRLQYGLR